MSHTDIKAHHTDRTHGMKWEVKRNVKKWSNFQIKKLAKRLKAKGYRTLEIVVHTSEPAELSARRWVDTGVFVRKQHVKINL